MVFWIKQQQEDGSVVRLEDKWTHSIYVGADDKPRLKSALAQVGASQLVKGYEFVQKYERITDASKSEVLKVTLSNSYRAEELAKQIMLAGRFGEFRLYNVDVLPAQSYFYEHGIFPLAFCSVSSSSRSRRQGDGGGGSNFSWNLEDDDDVWKVDYKLPEFRTLHLTVNPKNEAKIPRFTDGIGSIILESDEETIEISGKPEAEMLSELEREMSGLDPDFVFTEDGDWFLFPYLAYRAEVNDTSLALGRESNGPLRKKAAEKSGGSSFFSYGRVYYRPSSVQLRGRVHIDTRNSFILEESGLQGLYEVARVCRMPLHKASRASIGRCMSSLQFYHATIRDVLIPWRPNVVEHLKSTWELLIADRGGTILEPEIGVHEQVAEFDFASLYPNIMSKKNLSGETVLCECCPNSDLRVPELDYHICKNRTGIVPLSLEILLVKRARYKQLMKSATTPPDQKAIFDARQNSLKWILVTSFGYLGYSNSKFGRIDAHIATCAFDRQVFMQAVRVAERLGYIVLHGIVDSLWVKKPVGGTTEAADYMALKDAIEKETGFAISFEGEYKWVAFVHSKDNEQVPVPNRYFGVFAGDGNKLKIRGIGQRRHDTPAFFSRCEGEVLKIMAAGNTAAEVRGLMPAVKETFHRYARLLRERKAPLTELVFTKRLSKEADEYRANTVETSALRQLLDQGRHLHAGEVLQYVITDYYYKKKGAKRAIPVQLIDKGTTTSYDARRYTELLADMISSITEPFGISNIAEI